MRTRNYMHSRGVAMLLVIISLMMATILTVSYLASRDNSTAIGENISNSAQARWAADSALELGTAILQTETAWRTSHASGVLVDDYSLADAQVQIHVMDMETNGAPTSTSEHVQLTATADVEGVKQSATAMVYIPPVNASVDVDLSEFALFATERIELSQDATVMRWPRAPLSRIGRPLAVGVRSGSASTVTITDNAAILDGRVYSPDGASASVVSISNGTKVGSAHTMDVIPMPAPPNSGVSAPPAISLAPLFNLIGGTGILNASQRSSVVNFSSGAQRTLQGLIQFVSDTDMNLQGSKIIINGNVKMVVFNDLTLQNSSIELMNGAKLTLYIGDNLNMRDSYIGNVRADNTRDSTGKATPIDPERIRIFRLPNKVATENWVLDGNSVLKGSVYAPNVDFRIKDQSAVYGRVAAQRIRVTESAALYYDHVMDGRAGYTSQKSPMYEVSGHLKPQFASLASLDTSALQAAADSSLVNVRSALDKNVTCLPASAVAPIPPVVPVTQPTPRPVEVEYSIMSYGTSVNDLEQN